MSEQLALILLGALLLLGGALPGLKAKEIEIPKLPIVARLFAIAAGIFVLGIGVAWNDLRSSSSSDATIVAAQPVVGSQRETVTSNTPTSQQQPAAGTIAPPQIVEWHVIDMLGREQIAESATLYVDGAVATTLMINAYADVSEATLYHAPGSYAYAIELETIIGDGWGNQWIARGYGEGVVDVYAGATYYVAAEYVDPYTMNVWLQQ